MENNENKSNGLFQRRGVKWMLVLYDALLLTAVWLTLIFIYPSETQKLPPLIIGGQILLALFCILGTRLLFRTYHLIWRYARAGAYLQLIACDAVGSLLFYVLHRVIPGPQITFLRILCNVSANLLASIVLRLLYQQLYTSAERFRIPSRFLRRMASFFTGLNIDREVAHYQSQERKTNIAIVGAGRVGVMLAEELTGNPSASYRPVCFIDTDRDKVGRYIRDIRVLPPGERTLAQLALLHVTEIVFAIPGASPEKKKELYDFYKNSGCRLKTYDYPMTQSITLASSRARRQLRSFEPEELLFREVKDFASPETKAFYKGKTVLISGGGGSIGSELSRQIAKMEPRRLVIADVYENNAYDLQQELKIAWGDALDLQVEIVSVCDRPQLEQVFRTHRPQIVLHAAAHKHVPLMERNCCEAVKNNVFGTLNMVELAEQYQVEKFIMISTDKAVNPTNVMGATKRMCEMIVQSRRGATQFSATRFGNVLGSNGSVIPLFRRQIAAGGPVTLTDFRIIRYFMTIPEASQLVLTSGAMARQGELYVLDMGKPVKILDLAENMIHLSGFEPYKDIDIVEVGLRPGEKLYEELLLKTEELDKTSNSMIFVERDRPLPQEEVARKLQILRKALETENDDLVREALRQVVPTFCAPEEVNAGAGSAPEMLTVHHAPVK